MSFCAVERSDGIAFRVSWSADVRESLENSACARRTTTLRACRTRRHPATLSLNTEFKMTTRNLEDTATGEARSGSWKRGPRNIISVT